VLSRTQPEGDGLNAVLARVTDRIFRGSEVHYLVTVNGTQLAVSARQHDLVDHDEDVWLTWNVNRTLLLH
jgi:hypothetical protein